jgi:hypothetical protein
MTASVTWKKKLADTAKTDLSTEAAAAGAPFADAVPAATATGPAAGKRGRQQDNSAGTPAKRGKNATEATSSSPGAGPVVVDRSPVCSSWLEDVLAAVKLTPASSDVANPKDRLKFQVLAMQVALEFAWTKRVVFAGSTYVAWSALRPQLVSFVANVEKVSGQLAEALAGDVQLISAASLAAAPNAHAEDSQPDSVFQVKQEMDSPRKLKRQLSLAALEALEKAATQSVPVPAMPGAATAASKCHERSFTLSELMGFADRSVVEQATGRIEACWVTSPAIKLLESLCEAIVNMTVFSQLPSVNVSVFGSTAAVTHKELARHVRGSLLHYFSECVR